MANKKADDPFRDFDEILELESEPIVKKIKGRTFRFHSSASIVFREKFWDRMDNGKGEAEKLLNIEVADSVFSESLTKDEIGFLKKNLSIGSYLSLAVTILQLQGVIPTTAELERIEKEAKEGAGPNRQARRKAQKKSSGGRRRTSSKSGSARSTRTGNASTAETS